MDFLKLREAAGLTLEKAAELSGYGLSTINGLELRGEGSHRLREKLLEIYGAQKSQQPILREAAPGYLVDDALSQMQNIKEEIASLERILKEMKTRRHAISSTSPSSAEDLLDAASETEDRKPRKS